MTMRVGIDLQGVDEVEASLGVHAERYLARVFTPAEVDDCRTPAGMDARSLAARFAAKEAAIKVLRPGDEPLPWTSIETRRAPSGAVALTLRREAAALAAAEGVGTLSLSLTHDRGLAAAVVVAETHPVR